jgi:hypothetical protein
MAAGKWLTMVVLGAAAVLMLLPGSAGANVYCVDATPGLGDNGSVDPSCMTPLATMAEALSAARINAGADSVLVGPGNYTLPNSASDELTYSDSTPGNVLTFRGIGQPHLTMGGTSGDQVGIFVSAVQGSSVEGLTVTIPANSDSNGDTGLRLGGKVVGRGLTVNGPAATNANGFNLTAGSTLSGSTVDLPTNSNPTDTAVVASSGDAAIVDSHLRAFTAISTSGNVLKVERTTIDAQYGAHTDGGTIEFHDSLIELGGRVNAIGVQLANDNAGALALNTVIDGTTIVGGGANSVGIRVQANDNLETAKATIFNTLISGPAKSIQVWADNGRKAEATVSYSNYDSAAVDVNQNLNGSGPAGTATLAASNVTNLTAGFVDAAAGNFHLARTSPLIDLGDPKAPPAGEFDVDGQARAASPDCPVAAGRRDIGADELVPNCTPASEPQVPPATIAALPRTTIAGKHRVTAVKKRVKVTFRLSSSEAGDSFRCKVDKAPYKPCKAKFTISLKRGKHTISAVAIGAAGPDPSAAAITVKVVKPAPKHRPAPRD